MVRYYGSVRQGDTFDDVKCQNILVACEPLASTRAAAQLADPRPTPIAYLGRLTGYILTQNVLGED